MGPDTCAHEMLLWESSSFHLEPRTPPLQNFRVITPTGNNCMADLLTFRLGEEKPEFLIFVAFQEEGQKNWGSA